MTAPGIEPATFRFVAHCVNQLRHSVLLAFWDVSKNVIIIFKAT
jgi:hypothetical protein